MRLLEIDRDLGGATRVLLDSSTLLAFHNTHERVHAGAVHLLRRIQDAADPLQGYFSAVSVMELLVRPLQAGPKAVGMMEAFLTKFPNLHLIEVNYEVGRSAALLRSRIKLAPPDALVAASGLHAGCEAVVTNDDRWVRRLSQAYPHVRWLYLDAYQDEVANLRAP
ncbi:MAG: type II toxin-antitoxin system VapC family toxin [Chloroflexota bacterium]